MGRSLDSPKGQRSLGGLEPDQPKAELLRGGNGYRWFPGDSSPKVSCIPEGQQKVGIRWYVSTLEINQCSLVQNVKALCSLGLWAMERDIPQVIQKEAKKRDPSNRS